MYNVSWSISMHAILILFSLVWGRGYKVPALTLSVQNFLNIKQTPFTKDGDFPKNISENN